MLNTKNAIMLGFCRSGYKFKNSLTVKNSVKMASVKKVVKYKEEMAVTV